MDEKPKRRSFPFSLRRWLRFTLRTFLIAVTLICIWSAWHVSRARRQKDAVEAVRASHGAVDYDYQFGDGAQRANVTAESPWPSSLIDAFGIDIFHNVASVQFFRRSDDVMPRLGSFPSLRKLNLIWADDETMLHIAPLSKLEYLTAFDAGQLSKSGSQRLGALTRLKVLLFQRSRLTDDSLAALSHCSQLEELHLVDKGNRFSDAGLKYVANLANLRHLVLGFSEGEITDEGARHLLNLQRLEVLSLMRTRISTPMQERLKQLPKLKLCILNPGRD